MRDALCRVPGAALDGSDARNEPCSSLLWHRSRMSRPRYSPAPRRRRAPARTWYPTARGRGSCTDSPLRAIENGGVRFKCFMYHAVLLYI